MNTADTEEKTKIIFRIPHSDPVCALTIFFSFFLLSGEKNNETIFSTVKLLSIFFFTFMFYK